MPFTKAQATLKKILPASWFNFVYEIACFSYRLWQKTADKFYYRSSYLFYLLTGNASGLNRNKIILQILPYTMVGRSGILATYKIADTTEREKRSGSFVECGVAKGGCAAMMAMIAKGGGSGRSIWLFDSFEGLPAPTQDDREEANRYQRKDKSRSALLEGYCLGTYEQVSDLLFTRLGLPKDNIFMVKGWFQDTLPKYKEEIGEIAVLRIDADWYESTKCCLENLYDNVVAGGHIYIDDYGLPGCKKAVDDFLKSRRLKTTFIFDTRGGIYFKKP